MLQGFSFIWVLSSHVFEAASHMHVLPHPKSTSSLSFAELRAVFDAYFNADFGILPDRIFLPTEKGISDHGPTNFIDVTDVSGTCSEEWELRFREANQMTFSPKN
jgi:hypothetical protein